jgi:hypothetical protein
VKSRKMTEPHAQAWKARACAVLGVRRGTRTCGDTAGVGNERDHRRAWEAGQSLSGRQARVSRGGWVGRPTRRLVRPLGPGDGPMDPSP